MGDLWYNKVLVSLDSILILRKTLNDRLETYRRLQAHGMGLNKNKYYFLLEETEYIGYFIKDGQVSPNSMNISVIKEFQMKLFVVV